MQAETAVKKIIIKDKAWTGSPEGYIRKNMNNIDRQAVQKIMLFLRLLKILLERVAMNGLTTIIVQAIMLRMVPT